MATPYIRALDPSGEAVSNYPLQISNAIAVGGTTYYYGRLPRYTDNTILEFADTTYGAWTGTGKTGTHLTVKSAGLPTTNELLFDIGSAAFIADTQQNVYIYYNAYGSVLGASGGSDDELFLIPGLLDRDATATVASVQLPAGGSFEGAGVSVIDAVSEDVVFTITSGSGETSISETLTLSSGDTDAQTTFASAITYTSNEHIVIQVGDQDGGANNAYFRMVRA